FVMIPPLSEADVACELYAISLWACLIGIMEALRRNCSDDVRFTPKSGHSQRRLRCPLSAKSGHRDLHDGDDWSGPLALDCCQMRDVLG
ncbi:MAG: hypothetical protein ACR2PG_07420, partial [Hyphomicrobiaceae bacterium]